MMVTRSVAVRGYLRARDACLVNALRANACVAVTERLSALWSAVIEGLALVLRSP